MSRTQSLNNLFMKTFADRVRDVVRTIPKGKTMTYAEVAKKAGNANAARAVGTVMKGNFAKDIPCHRVIRSDGTIGAVQPWWICCKASIART
jgi:O-6-methylguanine DNA methyltransferase